MGSWRRGMIGTVALATCALVISACGGSGSGDTGGKVNLTFWSGLTGPDRPAVEHTVKEFNASQDKIHVSMQLIPWDVLYQKLLPAYGAGKGPDLVGIDSNQIPVYASKHVLQPVDALVSGKGADSTTTRSCSRRPASTPTSRRRHGATGRPTPRS